MAIATIVNQIKNKDDAAFEKIYNEYHQLVFYVIYQIVKDKEAALDLVQDTFLNVYSKIDQYDGGNFKYWILSIAKNLALNYYNRVIKKEENVIHNDEMVESYEDKPAPSLGKYDEILNKHFTQEEKDLLNEKQQQFKDEKDDEDDKEEVNDVDDPEDKKDAVNKFAYLKEKGYFPNKLWN